jgi:hypothetical protein
MDLLREGVRHIAAAGADRAGFADYLAKGEHLGW